MIRGLFGLLLFGLLLFGLLDRIARLAISYGLDLTGSFDRRTNFSFTRRVLMRLKAMLILSIALILAANAIAADPKLDGAYKFVGLKFQGGGQTEAEAKGMIVVR